MQRCGLLTNKNEPVPLKSIEVDLQVQGHVATVTSILQYVNEEQNPLEALFVFPMPSEAALCHFSAKIADQEIVAEVQEKQKAREQYDDALSSGQQAFMLEESDESSDVFRLSVGALPPKQSTTITFIYIIELSVQADHSLRFCLPAVLNPRYTPAGSGGGIVSEISSSAGVPYTLSFAAHVTSPNPITKVESKCSLDPLEFLNTEHTKAKVSLCAGHKFDRDVELFVFYQNPHQLTAVVEAGDPAAQPGTLMKDSVVMLSFYPEFPQSVMSSMTSSGEFVFIMDRSGSMACPMSDGSNAQSRINCARDTLLLLLKSLPIGCYFNIYGFGSHYESFFPKSVQYSQETMEQALVKVQQLQADMGGTEILQPLEHIYTQPCIPNHPRQLFIFTDGEVGNTRDVLQCVRQNAELHRCFSFGIGEGASTALIEGLAKNSSGHAQFITGADRMQPKVMQSLQYALQPAVVDVREVWSGVTTTSLSPSITSLFDGQRALIYAQLNGEESQNPDAKGKLTLQYRIGDKEATNTVEFLLKPTENNGLTIHRLSARSLIRSLERQEKDEGADKDALKARVVELSTKSGVSSSHTAFIAVHKGSGKPVEGAMVTRRVPTARMRYCASRQMGGGGIMFRSMNMSGRRACALPRLTGGGSSSNMLDMDGPMPQIRRLRAGGDGFLNCNIMSDGISSDSDDGDAAMPAPDTLLQLYSVQKASGCWEMESTLAQVLGKSEEELLKLIPQQVDSGVWATLLALIWLHGFKMDAEIEWKFVGMKAVAWIRNQNVGNLAECVRVGNSLLGCQVEEDSLGI